MKISRLGCWLSMTTLALSLAAIGCGGDDSETTPGGGSGGATGGSGGATGGTGGATGGSGGETGGTGGATGGSGGETGGSGGATGGSGGETGGTGGTGGSSSPDDDNDGYTVADGDCDDTNPDINPGAKEICNEIDDNCNNQIDEGVTTTFYLDSDGDAFGVDNPATNVTGCVAPTGYSATAGDCDDTNGLAFPGNPEVCDGIDNDCANGVDDGVTFNTYYQDADGDGYGNDSITQKGCVAPGPTWVLQGGDCDDGDAERFPGNPEICDGKDNDCNPATPEPGLTTYYRDADGDGYGNPNLTQTACGTPPAGYVTQAGDCNDSNAAINPGAIELCDGIDNNCINGIDEGPLATWIDADGDGYGASGSPVVYKCEVKPGYAANDDDCNDKNAAINPGAAEIPGNGVDENCDGSDTTAGTLCGQDTLAITTIPGRYNGDLNTADPATGGPMGAGYRWDDIEVSTTAGQTFTVLYHSHLPSSLQPRLYAYGPNSCSTLIGFTNGSAYGSPKGSHLAMRTISNASAGYYYFPVTTATAGQSGSYQFDVVPGAMGTACGGDSTILWPPGWRVAGSLLANDTQPAGTPVPSGRYADDYEFYLPANQTYTALVGASPYTDELYVARQGACATPLGTSSNITNGGRKVEFTTTQAGIYVAYPTSTTASQTGSYVLNVIPGAIGKRCFDGPGSIGGTGKDYVLWPPNGSSTGTLSLTDRSGDFGARVFDDYETWLEAGDVLNVSVTRTSGTFTPSVRIARVENCTSIVASSSQTTGTVGSVSYTPTTQGAYVIIITTSQTNQTGNYTVNITLN